MNKKYISLVVIFVLIFTACDGNMKAQTSPVSNLATASPTHIPVDLNARAVLTSVGDVILHQSVIDGGKLANGKYNYDYIFKYAAPIFKASDYTIANYEGTLNGSPYSGYPMFGAPDAIATALKNAGVDMVTTANNHAFDRGVSGLQRTPTVFIKNGIKVIGTRSKTTDPKFQIVNVNGIKIGFTGYTFETIGTPTGKALNGMPLPSSAFGLVDSFNPSRESTFQNNMKQMAARIKAMKKAKAECIVFELHWGQEYQTVSDATEKRLAKFLSDNGVDVIFGHHPHVLQEISVIHSSVSGKNTLVYYSLGNVLANMLYNTHGTNGYAEDAAIARVEIARDGKGKISIVSGRYIKTYCYKDNSTGKTKHSIVPVKAALKNPSGFGMKNQTSLLTASSQRISKVLSKSGGMKNGILIREY